MWLLARNEAWAVFSWSSYSMADVRLNSFNSALTKGTQQGTVSSMHEFDWDDEKDAVLE